MAVVVTGAAVVDVDVLVVVVARVVVVDVAVVVDVDVLGRVVDVSSWDVVVSGACSV